MNIQSKCSFRLGGGRFSGKEHDTTWGSSRPRSATRYAVTSLELSKNPVTAQVRTSYRWIIISQGVLGYM
jgi:hypothetical protein